MHSLKLLHKRLLKSQVISHPSRLLALMKAVEGLLNGGKLTLTHLGRHLPGKGYEKHKVKCMDRLLGNTKLHDERQKIYWLMGHWLLSQTARPIIIVDWSDVYEGQQFMMLTAGVPIGGRTLTLYEAVYPMKQYNSPKAHKHFLSRLATVIPQTKRPIIVTDAGFRGPWFRAINELGWDWVGRIRKGVHYTLDQGKSWESTQRLYCKATFAIQYVGKAILTTHQPYTGHLYLVKKNFKGKRPLKRYGDRALALVCRKLYQDPWLLVTSLPHMRGIEKKVEQLYALRMQIEETFRDLKNGRWGLGLEYARSYHQNRLENLLLIGALGSFLIWLNGIVVKTQGWSRYFQANTVKHRTTLSLFFLGKRLHFDSCFKYSMKNFIDAFRELINLPSKQAHFVGIP